MKQIRIYYNGKDILIYILVATILLLFILFELGEHQIFKIQFNKLFGVLAFVLFNLTVLNYIKKIHYPKNVNLEKLKSTEDIRIPSFSYKGYINQGDNFSFLKIYFNEKEIYLYFRNFFPIKIYQGPFILKKSFSYDNSFYVTEFKKINKSELMLRIANNTNSTSYKLIMRNFTISDYNLIIKNFKKLGWELSE